MSGGPAEPRPSSRLRLAGKALALRADRDLPLGPAETRELGRFLGRLADIIDAEGKAAVRLAGSSEGIEREVARLRETAVDVFRFGVPRRP